jgi:hypothetical protein
MGVANRAGELLVVSAPGCSWSEIDGQLTYLAVSVADQVVD